MNHDMFETPAEAIVAACLVSKSVYDESQPENGTIWAEIGEWIGVEFIQNRPPTPVV